MPNIMLNEVWELRVACYTVTQASVNTFHFKCTTQTGSIADTFAANLLDNSSHGDWKAVLSDDARYRGLSLQRRYPLPRTRPAIDVDNDGPGTVAGEVLPGQVSGIITWTTDLAGPKYRGRTYVPFPSETHNEVPGQPADAYITLLNALADRMDGPLVITNGADQVVLTRVLFNRESGTTQPITGHTSRKKWATQQRRGSYGKQNTVPF